MFECLYLRAIKVAGYSGFVIYGNPSAPNRKSPSSCVWMVPGTFFDDWDNR